MATAAQRGPRTKRGDDRLAQIRMEASRLFVEKGYDGTSMQDIADAMGLTKAGLYHFVRSKEDLLSLIVDVGLDRVEREVLAPAEAIADPADRIATYIRLHVANIGLVESDVGNPITSVTENLSGLSRERRARANARLRRPFDLLRGALDELQAQGRLADGVDTTATAFSIVGMVMWTNRWRRPGGRLSASAVAETIVRLTLHGAMGR